MPLSSVRNEAAARFAEANSLLGEISARESQEGTATTSGLNVQKALFLVAAYAAFEFTTNLLVIRTAEAISAAAVPHTDAAVSMLSMAMDPEIKSISSPGRKVKWQRRSTLFKKLFSSDPMRIHEEALLAELGNIWCASLDQVFEAFGLAAPSVYDPRAKPYIDEVVERRNAVAHGRESAADVGSRYTTSSLRVRLEALERQKDYLISRFEPILKDELYKRVNSGVA